MVPAQRLRIAFGGVRNVALHFLQVSKLEMGVSYIRRNFKGAPVRSFGRGQFAVLFKSMSVLHPNRRQIRSVLQSFSIASGRIAQLCDARAASPFRIQYSLRSQKRVMVRSNDDAGGGVKLSGAEGLGGCVVRHAQLLEHLARVVPIARDIRNGRRFTLRNRTHRSRMPGGPPGLGPCRNMMWHMRRVRTLWLQHSSPPTPKNACSLPRQKRRILSCGLRRSKLSSA
jgi:hypothetical protein